MTTTVAPGRAAPVASRTVAGKLTFHLTDGCGRTRHEHPDSDKACHRVFHARDHDFVLYVIHARCNRTWVDQQPTSSGVSLLSGRCLDRADVMLPDEDGARCGSRARYLYAILAGQSVFRLWTLSL